MFPKFFAHGPLRQAVGDVIAHVRIRSVRSHVVKAHSRRPGIPAPPECLRRPAEAGSQLFICLSDARLACRRVYRVQAVNVECDC
jgi:hypothetical protein